MCEECGMKKPEGTSDSVIFIRPSKRLPGADGGASGWPSNLDKVREFQGVKKGGTQEPECGVASSDCQDLLPSSGLLGEKKSPVKTGQT